MREPRPRADPILRVLGRKVDVAYDEQFDNSGADDVERPDLELAAHQGPRGLLRLLGPGVITGAADDPGKPRGQAEVSADVLRDYRRDHGGRHGDDLLHGNVIQALVIASAFSGVAAVPLLVLMTLLGADRTYMSDRRSGRRSLALIWFSAAGTTAASLALLGSFVIR